MFRLPNGIGLAFLAALLWTIVGIISLRGFELSPEASPLAGTLVRVVLNLAFVLAVHWLVRKRRGLPWAKRSRGMWLWGICGCLTIATYFVSVQRLGVAEATMLQGVQGILLALLAPYFLGQRATWASFLAVAGGLAGIFLLLGGGATHSLADQAWAIASGTFTSFAYLVLSAEKVKHSPETVSYYWSLVGVIGVSLLAWGSGANLQLSGEALAAFLASGLVACLAQWLTTLAYQNAPAAFVGATSYLIPAFSYAWELASGTSTLEPVKLSAALLICASGMALPFLALRKVERSLVGNPG